MSDVENEMRSHTDLPIKWRWATLGDFGTWTSGGTPSRKHPEYFGGDIPWVKTGDLPDGPITKIPETITSSGLENSSAKICPPGTVLIAMYGATIGKLGTLSSGATTNQACAALLPTMSNEDALPYVFKYLLYSRERLKALGQGGAQPNISQGILKEFPIAVAPLAEQERIVSKIDELFSRIEKGEQALEQVRKLVERYRQSVLKAAVTGELTRTWREQQAKSGQQPESGQALLERILKARREAWEKAELEKLRAKGKPPTNDKWKQKYKEPGPIETDYLGELPDGWQRVRVDTAGETQLGRQRSPAHHSGDHMRPYLRVANVFEERIDTDDVMEMNFTPEEFVTYGLRVDDILLNEGQSKELVGRPAIYRDELPGSCFTNTLVRFRCTSAILPEFALIVFLHFMKSGQFQKIAKITTNIAHLGAGRFSEMAFPVPSLDEQQEIVDRVNKQRVAIDHFQNDVVDRKKQVGTLRQSILKSAFSGQLVPQDPTDEPASTLLKRIADERAAQAETETSTPRRGRRRRT
ncbi:MAG: restriction endonuclease subunit S [Gammaproteobacteria bacterium]